MDSQRGRSKDVTFSCSSNAEAKKTTNFFLDRASIPINLNFQDTMIWVTMFVLFGDDVRILSYPKADDEGFMYLMIISLVLFVLELLLYSWAKTTIIFEKPSTILGAIPVPFTVQGYLFDFYFWLDLMAVISMFPDIPPIANAIGLTSLGTGTNAAAYGKLGRIARMVRLVRLVKLYKVSSGRAQRKQREAELLELTKKGVITLEEYTEKLQQTDTNKQSKVGAELSDQLTRRVIAIVLIMLCVVPLLTVLEVQMGPEVATSYIQKLNKNGDTRNLRTAISSTMEQYSYYSPSTWVRKNKDCPDDDKNCDEEDSMKANFKSLVYLGVYPYNEFVCDGETTPFELPYNSLVDDGIVDKDYVAEASKTGVKSEREKDYYAWPAATDGYSVCDNNAELIRKLRPGEMDVFLFGDDSSGSSTLAIFSVKTQRQEDALYNVLTTVFVAIMLLLGAHTFSSDADKLVLEPIQSMMDLVEKVAEDPSREIVLDYSDDDNVNYETQLIESAIQKITSLLRVGFGVAGSEIIKENLNSSNDSDQPLDLVDSPGKLIYAAFGFCDIHEFDHLTDKLEVQIMDFVNDVATVVHEQVHTWAGQCNKNLGNSFLMTWRVPYAATGGQSNIDVTRLSAMRTIADKAMIGYVKVVADLNRDEKVMSYRKRQDLNLDGKPFKVHMGFGLHIGWGIEGPVGSLQKVDATYLSPHVNMAARLETASRQYGVPLLMSEIFFRCLSTKAKEQCRKLDRVSVKGSVQSIDIYTFDAYQDQQLPVRRATKDEEVKSNEYDPDYEGEDDIFNTDQDLIALKRHFTPELSELHTKGVGSYLRGNWQEANKYLQAVDDKLRETGYGGDGPSQTLIRYMGKRNFTPDEGWDEKKGRALTSK
mmetsp:Transcript_16939/g.39621  ORF Transcript_16939/g.39621 Transcript_16939/m.39621 type:complete len:875 (+) Transcript_16939:288-2912(+)